MSTTDTARRWSGPKIAGVIVASFAIAGLGGATIGVASSSGDDGREPGSTPGARVEVVEAPPLNGDVGEFDTDSGLPPAPRPAPRIEARVAAIPVAPVDQDGDGTSAPAAPAGALPGESGNDDQDG